MKLTNTKVSVIIPSYNASHTLPLCIESVISQTYQDLEIIVIDDNSSDDTYKIAKVLKKCDSRIKVYKNKKRYGVATCLNRTMRFAKGKFVTFMNPADTISKNKIAKQVKFLQKNHKTVAVGTQCIIKGPTGRIQKTELPTLHEDIYKQFVTGSAMCFESGLINRTRIPKDTIKFTSNTYPIIFSGLYLKLVEYGNLANLNEYLYKKREYAKSHYSKQTIGKKAGSYMSLFMQSVNTFNIRTSFEIFRKPLISPFKQIISQ